MMSRFAPMKWWLKFEYIKAFTLCFLPVGAWAVYQEIELNKIKSDDSYLDEILKGAKGMQVGAGGRSQLGGGISSNRGAAGQFVSAYASTLDEQRSDLSKKLEDQAYGSIK
eukprot:sb/3477224/